MLQGPGSLLAVLGGHVRTEETEERQGDRIQEYRHCRHMLCHVSHTSTPPYLYCLPHCKHSAVLATPTPTISLFSSTLAPVKAGIFPLNPQEGERQVLQSVSHLSVQP